MIFPNKSPCKVWCTFLVMWVLLSERNVATYVKTNKETQVNIVSLASSLAFQGKLPDFIKSIHSKIISIMT